MEGGLQLGSRMTRCSATPCLAQEPATLTQFQLNRDRELICFAPSSAAKSCSHITHAPMVTSTVATVGIVRCNPDGLWQRLSTTWPAILASHAAHTLELPLC